MWPGWSIWFMVSMSHPHQPGARRRTSRVRSRRLRVKISVVAGGCPNAAGLPGERRLNTVGLCPGNVDRPLERQKLDQVIISLWKHSDRGVRWISSNSRVRPASHEKPVFRFKLGLLSRGSKDPVRWVWRRNGHTAKDSRFHAGSFQDPPCFQETSRPNTSFRPTHRVDEWRRARVTNGSPHSRGVILIGPNVLRGSHGTPRHAAEENHP